MSDDSTYHFVVSDNYEDTKNCLGKWNPESYGIGPVPIPQLLYSYNTAPPSKKIADEVAKVNAGIETLTKVGTATMEEVVSKVATMNKSLEEKIEKVEEKIQSGFSMEVVEKLLVREREENQKFQQNMFQGFGNIFLQMNAQNAKLQAAQTEALLMNPEMSELIARRQVAINESQNGRSLAQRDAAKTEAEEL